MQAYCPRCHSACQVFPLCSFVVCKQFENSYLRQQGFLHNLSQDQCWCKPTQPIRVVRRQNEFTVHKTTNTNCWMLWQQPFRGPGAKPSSFIHSNASYECFSGQWASWGDLCICLFHSPPILAGGSQGHFLESYLFIYLLFFLPGEKWKDVRQIED